MYCPPPGEQAVNSWPPHISVIGHPVGGTHRDEACLNDGVPGEDRRYVCVACGHKGHHRLGSWVLSIHTHTGGGRAVGCCPALTLRTATCFSRVALCMWILKGHQPGTGRQLRFLHVPGIGSPALVPPSSALDWPTAPCGSALCGGATFCPVAAVGPGGCLPLCSPSDSRL